MNKQIRKHDVQIYGLPLSNDTPNELEKLLKELTQQPPEFISEIKEGYLIVIDNIRLLLARDSIELGKFTSLLEKIGLDKALNFSEIKTLGHENAVHNVIKRFRDFLDNKKKYLQGYESRLKALSTMMDDVQKNLKDTNPRILKDKINTLLKDIKESKNEELSKVSGQLEEYYSLVYDLESLKDRRSEKIKLINDTFVEVEVLANIVESWSEIAIIYNQFDFEEEEYYQEEEDYQEKEYYLDEEEYQEEEYQEEENQEEEHSEEESQEDDYQEEENQQGDPFPEDMHQQYDIAKEESDLNIVPDNVHKKIGGNAQRENTNSNENKVELGSELEEVKLNEQIKIIFYRPEDDVPEKKSYKDLVLDFEGSLHKLSDNSKIYQPIPCLYSPNEKEPQVWGKYRSNIVHQNILQKETMKFYNDKYRKDIPQLNNFKIYKETSDYMLLSGFEFKNADKSIDRIVQFMSQKYEQELDTLNDSDLDFRKKDDVSTVIRDLKDVMEESNANNWTQVNAFSTEGLLKLQNFLEELFDFYGKRLLFYSEDDHHHVNLYEKEKRQALRCAHFDFWNTQRSVELIIKLFGDAKVTSQEIVEIEQSIIKIDKQKLESSQKLLNEINSVIDKFVIPNSFDDQIVQGIPKNPENEKMDKLFRSLRFVYYSLLSVPEETRIELKSNAEQLKDKERKFIEELFVKLETILQEPACDRFKALDICFVLKKHMSYLQSIKAISEDKTKKKMNFYIKSDCSKILKGKLGKDSNIIPVRPSHSQLEELQVFEQLVSRGLTIDDLPNDTFQHIEDSKVYCHLQPYQYKHENFKGQPSGIQVVKIYLDVPTKGKGSIERGLYLSESNEPMQRIDLSFIGVITEH